MIRHPSAIFLILLLVVRAVVGLGSGAVVWCGDDQHPHTASHVQECSDDCDAGTPSLLPVPADFHDLDCDCAVEKEIGDEPILLASRYAEFEHVDCMPALDWTVTSVPDLRVRSFRGPPRPAILADRAQSGRLVLVESTRLNI